MRVGLYTDMVFRCDGARLTTDKAFIRLVTAVADELGEVVLFGRLAPEPGRSPYEVPEERIRFVPLPHYPRVTHLRQVLATLPRAGRMFASELDGLDAAVVFGPHPVAFAFALLTRRAGVPLVLGVRHDYPEYIRHRLPGPAWGWAVPVARGLDLAFRRLARSAPAVVIGPDLARRYARGGGRVLETGVSLIAAADVVSAEAALARNWDGELRCLSVGRLASEKNPLLLVDTVAELRRRDPRWRLTIAGDGPLKPAVAEAVGARGLGSAVDLVGELPNGPQLWELYRSSHAFLHVSLTEGLPQVLVEAQAAGIPIVATDVGGVRAAMGDGTQALLVPPRSAGAAVDALERLSREPELRRRLVLAGLEHARGETLEAQVERLTAFIARARSPRAARLPQPPRRVLPAARSSARTRATGTPRRPGTPAAQGTSSPRD
jgi:glycosyltransferase involved in cell wall biosynthesis